MNSELLKRIEANMNSRFQRRKLTKAEQSFVAELNELMRRHGVSLSGSDQYDGADNFVGREYTFAKCEGGEDQTAVYLELRDVEEMLS